MRHRGLCGVLLASAAVAAAVGEPAGCRAEHPLSETVTDFHSAGESIVEALLRLGQEDQLCFGIEMADGELLKPAMDFHLRSATASTVTRQLLRTADRYEVLEQAGVVRIRHRSTPAPTLLDYRIPAFRVAGGTEVQAASGVLRMSLISHVHPEVRGFAGHYRPGDLTDTVGPLEETDRTVRELLSLIIVNSKGGMWIAKASHLPDGRLPPEPFWVIVQYTSPFEINSARMRPRLERFKQP